VTRIARLLAAAVLVGGLGLTACGGDDDDSASAKTSATISDRDAKAAARAAGVDEACVEGVRAYTAMAASVGSVFSGGGDIEANADAIEKYSKSAPSEIRDEMETLAGAYAAYVEAIRDSGWKPGTQPTPEQAAALGDAGKQLDDSKVKDASTKVSAYFDEHCKRK
jgi:hypothetical protein